MRHIGRPKLYDRLRLRLVLAVFCLSFIAIFARLVIVQLIKHPHLRHEAARQYNSIVTLRPERGRIFDRHGRELATSVPIPSVYVVPHAIEQPAIAAKQLATVLDLPLTTVQQRLASKAPFVWLARQIVPHKVPALQALGLRGVGIYMETRRFYPKRHLAGQVLGFVGVDEQGLGGLEFLYDRALLGSPRQLMGQRDARGRQLHFPHIDSIEQPRGADLHLTLDERLQYVAEKELAAQAQQVRAKSGLVIVMHPWTGDILALASYPFFNPNDFKDPQELVWRRNRAVTDPVEPGSTFKIVAAAAALEEKTVRPDETIFCENGVLIRGRRRLRDHHRYGRLNFTQIVEYSSNIGMIKANERLSATQFYDYMRRFGFGELSQVDFPGEDPGQLRPPRQWSAFSHDSLTIGQEITVTPLQLVTAFAAVANGGWLMRPRVVTRLVGGDTEQVIAPQARRRVLVRQTAAQLTAMLVGVVDRGTGKKAAVDGYTVAGKTGTAQKVEPSGVYSHRKVLASFVGFVPAEDPQAVILVMLDEPEKDRWGGTAAAPIFKRVAEQALHHLQVPSHYARPLTLEAKRMGDGG